MTLISLFSCPFSLFICIYSLVKWLFKSYGIPNTCMLKLFLFVYSLQVYFNLCLRTLFWFTSFKSWLADPNMGHSWKILSSLFSFSFFLGFFFFFFFFFFFWSFLGPYPWHMEVPRLGVNQIGGIAASLCHSHNNARSKPHLWPTPQLTAVLDP